MGEKDDGLGLSLSLSRSQTQQNNHHRSSWDDVFRSADENSETRPFKRGIDMNITPSVDEEAGASSLNSTISSISGKRSEREPIGNENEAERASSSRGSDDEDAAAASRKKLRLSKEQSLVLEETFKEQNTLNPKEKLALGKQLNLRPRQVEVWFQNRRARTKLKQTEVDCEYLKRCCENLTEENRRLQKEVQELRALKLSPQHNMHMNPPDNTNNVPFMRACRYVIPRPRLQTNNGGECPPTLGSAITRLCIHFSHVSEHGRTLD